MLHPCLLYTSAPEEETVTDNEATKQGDTDKTGQNKKRLIEYTPLVENGTAVDVNTPCLLYTSPGSKNKDLSK